MTSYKDMLLTPGEMQSTIYSIPAREPGEDYSRLMEATMKAQLENFGVIPEGATFYKGGKSYWLAVRNLNKRKVLSRAGCDSEKGLYWTLEGVV